jgi:hypothetical protein
VDGVVVVEGAGADVYHLGLVDRRVHQEQDVVARIGKGTGDLEKRGEYLNAM